VRGFNKKAKNGGIGSSHQNEGGGWHEKFKGAAEAPSSTHGLGENEHYIPAIRTKRA